MSGSRPLQHKAHHGATAEDIYTFFIFFCIFFRIFVLFNVAPPPTEMVCRGGIVLSLYWKAGDAAQS